MTEIPEDNGIYAFWRYSDLAARRIVTSRADLQRKQERGFPKPVRLTEGQGSAALFRIADVKAWLDANLQEAEKQ